MKKLVVETSLFFPVLVSALCSRRSAASGVKEGVSRKIALYYKRNPPPPPRTYHTLERKSEPYLSAASRHNDENAGRYYHSLVILIALALSNILRSKKTPHVSVGILITRLLEAGVLTMPKKAARAEYRNSDVWYGFRGFVSTVIKQAAESLFLFIYVVFPPHIHGIIPIVIAVYTALFGFTHALHGKNIFCFGG
ncbi:MAG: hypothetical protein LBP19_10140 [Treponema sp.]|jgi:hypothetical protein|nr:hypothetical protein [Treponema sp.]